VKLLATRLIKQADENFHHGRSENHETEIVAAAHDGFEEACRRRTWKASCEVFPRVNLPPRYPRQG